MNKVIDDDENCPTPPPKFIFSLMVFTYKFNITTVKMI